MTTLVESWLSKYKFNNFIELETNVRQYVTCNIVDLLYYEKDDYIISSQTTTITTSSYSNNKDKEEEDGVAASSEDGGNSNSISLSDHIRYKLFPYERIIKEIVRCAIIPIGDHHNSSSSSSSSSKEENNNIKCSSSNYEDVLERRMIHLLTACKILDAMMTLDGISSSSSSSSSSNSKEHRNSSSSNNNNNSVRSSTNNGVQRLEGVSTWTVHHETCSDCLRLVVSAWSLLHRRQCALTTTKTTTMTMTTLEYQLLIWTERWINLCSCGEEMTNSSSIRRGILHTDEFLLIDIAKISLKFEKFANLDKKIRMLLASLENELSS
jgi:hypothetical protein